MKTIMTSFALLVLTLTTARAQDPAMEADLTAANALLDSATVPSSFMAASAKFDLIAEKYTDQWQPQYYAAYVKAIISYGMPEADQIKKDLMLDEADTYLANINALGVKNDHVYVLTALLANARMAVDGENRWQKYGPIFEDNLKKAKEINENNPHIYYLKAVSLFYTPKMFGGGPKKAKPYFEKAQTMYAQMTNKSVLVPYWGEKQNTDYLKQVNE